MWTPKSTLLQVLVSIQSMILVELPFFNEYAHRSFLISEEEAQFLFGYRPGYGQAVKEDRRSISYNKEVTLQTTKWAIVDWLKNEHQHGMWAVNTTSNFSVMNTDLSVV